MFNFITRIKNNIVFHIKAAVFYVLSTLATISMMAGTTVVNGFYLKLWLYVLLYGFGTKIRAVLFLLTALHVWVNRRLQLAQIEG